MGLFLLGAFLMFFNVSIFAMKSDLKNVKTKISIELRDEQRKVVLLEHHNNEADTSLRLFHCTWSNSIYCIAQEGPEVNDVEKTVKIPAEMFVNCLQKLVLFEKENANKLKTKKGYGGPKDPINFFLSENPNCIDGNPDIKLKMVKKNIKELDSKRRAEDNKNKQWAILKL